MKASALFANQSFHQATPAPVAPQAPRRPKGYADLWNIARQRWELHDAATGAFVCRDCENDVYAVVSISHPNGGPVCKCRGGPR